MLTPLQEAESLLPWLNDYKPVIKTVASTGSVYIIFGDQRLGVLRISNHRGFERFKYRWVYDLRPSMRDKAIWKKQKHLLTFNFGTEKVYRFLEELELFERKLNG